MRGVHWESKLYQQTHYRPSGYWCPQKDHSTVKAYSSRFISIMALVISSAARLSIAIAAEDWERDWTVVTMARNGSWGVGIDYPIAGAIAAAIRECRAMSSGGNDCGAAYAASRGGWVVRVPRCRASVFRSGGKTSKTPKRLRSTEKSTSSSSTYPTCQPVNAFSLSTHAVP